MGDDRQVHRPWWRRLSWVPGVLVLLVLFTVVGHLGEEERLIGLIGRSQPAWLLAAAALQAATYLSAAGVWQRVLHRAGMGQRLTVLAPLALARLFTDRVVPSGGLGGRLLVVRALERRGVGLPEAMAAILVDLITFYATFAAAVLATLGLLWLRHELNEVILSVVTGFLLVAAAVPAAALWLGRGGRLPVWARRLPHLSQLLEQIASAPQGLVRDPVVLAEGSALQLAVILLDSATLWMVLRAIGSPLGPAEVFASLVIASVAMTVILTPGGLGPFESASVAMLTLFRVPVEAALAATLLLRGFTYWLPMLPGLWVSRREVRQTGGGRHLSESAGWSEGASTAAVRTGPTCPSG